MKKLPDSVPNKRGRPRGSKSSNYAICWRETQKMLDLWIRGVSTSDIARVVGRNVQTIHERLQPYRNCYPELETIIHCKDRNPMVFTVFITKLFKTGLSEAALEKVPFHVIVKGLKTLLSLDHRGHAS